MSFFKKLFGFPSKDKSTIQTSSKLTRMERKELLLSQLETHVRSAYIPIVEETSASFTSNSKFGGYPYLRHEADWPICPNCNNHMQLFLQLNTEHMPVSQATGLVQIFYCTNDELCCDSVCEAYEAFSTSVVCRLIQVDGDSVTIKPKMEEIFKERRITSWEEKKDYPHYEELENLGIQLCVDDYQILEEDEIGIPLTGDKLYGWPNWIQSPEYPTSKVNKATLQFLFQIDSECNLPYMFGDSGCAYIFQNPKQFDELALNWSCC